MKIKVSAVKYGDKWSKEWVTLHEENMREYFDKNCACLDLSCFGLDGVLFLQVLDADD